MNTRFVILFNACAAALFALTATAAETDKLGGPQNHPSGIGPGEGWEINWRKIASGGTLSSGGGPWTLAGTVGQLDDTSRFYLAYDSVPGTWTPANPTPSGTWIPEYPWNITGGFWAPGFQIDSQGMIFRDRFQE